MKIFSTLLFLILFFSAGTKAQEVPNYLPYDVMSPKQLQVYRQNLWDTLPAAIGWVNDYENLFTTEEKHNLEKTIEHFENCLLYTSPSPRDRQKSRMPSSA